MQNLTLSLSLSLLNPANPKPYTTKKSWQGARGKILQGCPCWSIAGSEPIAQPGIPVASVPHTSCITLRTLNYGNYGIFLMMGNAGFTPSTVITRRRSKIVIIIMTVKTVKTINNNSAIKPAGMDALTVSEKEPQGA